MRFMIGPALKIEHMGSTSVSGLSAKPIIDILVGLPNLLRAKSTFVRPFAQLRYTYIPEYEAWLPGELFFSEEDAWTLDTPSSHHGAMQSTLERFPAVSRLLALTPGNRCRVRKPKKSLADEFGKNIEGFRKTKHRL